MAPPARICLGNLLLLGSILNEFWIRFDAKITQNSHKISQNSIKKHSTIITKSFQNHSELIQHICLKIMQKLIQSSIKIEVKSARNEIKIGFSGKNECEKPKYELHRWSGSRDSNETN